MHVICQWFRILKILSTTIGATISGQRQCRVEF